VWSYQWNYDDLKVLLRKSIRVGKLFGFLKARHLPGALQIHKVGIALNVSWVQIRGGL
jgi:hypothetical protein